MLENEIIPMYYARNSKGYSPEWVQTIKNSITKITPIYTTKRMMDDYFDRFYCKQAKRHALLEANGCKVAKEIAAWKENIAAHWDAIECTQLDLPQGLFDSPKVGDKYKLHVELDVKDLNDKGIGVELVAVRTSTHNNDKLYTVKELDLVKAEGSKLTYETEYQLDYAGNLKFGFRMFPKNELLPHRMDFAYVRWL